MSIAFRQLEARRSTLEQAAENAARNAHVGVFFETTGQGELITPVLKFEVDFLERPIVTTGVELRSGALVSGSFPNTTVGIESWVQTDRGFYVGAKLWVVVDSLGGTGYHLHHHVILEGLAIKKLAGDS